MAGLVPPVVSCVAIPILIIMKVVQLFWSSRLFLVLLGVSSFLGEETKRGTSCFEMVQTGGRGRCQVAIHKILILKSQSLCFPRSLLLEELHGMESKLAGSSLSFSEVGVTFTFYLEDNTFIFNILSSTFTFHIVSNTSNCLYCEKHFHFLYCEKNFLFLCGNH